MKYVTIINNEQFEIEIDKEGAVTLNGELRHVDFLSLGESLYSVIMENKSIQVVIDDDQGHYSVMLEGRLYDGQVLDERALLMAQRRGTLGVSSGEVIAPMPGLIVAVSVEVGQEIAQGQTVVILESMKMQNELKSPIDGVVEQIQVSPGQTVDKNALMVVVKAPELED